MSSLDVSRENLSDFRSVCGFVPRYERAVLRNEEYQKVRDYLLGVFVRLQKRKEIAAENAALGFFADYTKRWRDVRWFAYQECELYIKDTFGELAARFFGLSIFHGIYNSLRERGWRPYRGELPQPNGKIEGGLSTDLFYHFYYGRPMAWGKHEIRYWQSFAYLMLFDGEEDWKEDFSVLLEQYTELAVQVLIDDLAEGKYDPSSFDWYEGLYGVDMPNTIYTVTKAQMMIIDERLVADGRSVFFKIPRFG
jgi:hypothetical protein